MIKSTPAQFVSRDVGAPLLADVGNMRVTMKTTKFYTDGSTLASGQTYTVTRAWGKMAVEAMWASDTDKVLPLQGTVDVLTSAQTAVAAVSQPALSEVSFATRPIARSGIRVSTALLAQHATDAVAAGGAAAPSTQYDAIRGPLERAMRSTWFRKLRMWHIPLGADGDINAMRVCLVEASGTRALVNVAAGIVAGDYTAAGGLVLAAGKRLNTTFNISTGAPTATLQAIYPALSVSNWGFGAFALGYNSAGSGVMMGTETGNAHYLGFTGGSNASQMYSTQAYHVAVKGHHGVQYVNGSVQTWYRGWNRANTAVAAGALPNSVMAINSVNGGLNGVWTYGGSYIAEGLSQQELTELADVMADMNLALGRPIYVQNSLTAIGDSIVNRTNVSLAANSWPNRLAANRALTLIEQGSSGRAITAPGAASQFSSDTATIGYTTVVLRNLASLNVIAVGINDMIYKADLAAFAADYTKIVSNLVLAGVRPEALACLSPYWAPGGTQAVNDGLSQQLAQIIKGICAQYGIMYVDVLNGRLRGAGVAGGAWDSLGIHPNDATHGLIWQDIEDAFGSQSRMVGVAMLA